jgi:hypothetical protein
MADRLAGMLDGETVEPLAADSQRRLLTALVRAYARGGGELPPVEADELSTDEVAVTAAALMRAKDVTSFELAALFNV